MITKKDIQRLIDELSASNDLPVTKNDMNNFCFRCGMWGKYKTKIKQTFCVYKGVCFTYPEVYAVCEYCGNKLGDIQEISEINEKTMLETYELIKNNNLWDKR